MAPVRFSEGGAHGQEGLALLVEGGAILTRWGPMRGSIASPSGVRRSRVSLIGASFSWEGVPCAPQSRAPPKRRSRAPRSIASHSTREPTVLCFMTLHPHVNRWRFMRKGFSFNVNRWCFMRKGRPLQRRSRARHAKRTSPSYVNRRVGRAKGLPLQRQARARQAKRASASTASASSSCERDLRFNVHRALVMRKGQPFDVNRESLLRKERPPQRQMAHPSCEGRWHVTGNSEPFV